MALPSFKLPSRIMVCSCYCLHAILRSRSKSALERLSYIIVRARHDCVRYEDGHLGCKSSLDIGYGGRKKFEDRALEACEKFFWSAEPGSPQGGTFYEDRFSRPYVATTIVTRSMTADQRASRTEPPDPTMEDLVSALRGPELSPTIVAQIRVGTIIA